MGQAVVTRYPFSGKNQVALVSEEIVVTTAVPTYGKRRTETITGTTPNGNATWKSIGYVTGGSTTETRTWEEVQPINQRNVQQLVETKFAASGSLEIDYQNGRIFYFGIAANNGLGTPAQTAPGIAHTDDVGGIVGLDRHIIYEPEILSGSFTPDAVADIASFNLIDGYTFSAAAGYKIVRQYVGCKIDALNCNFSREGQVKVSANWQGAQVYSAQASTAANLLVSDFLSYQEVFPPMFGKVYVQAWTYPTSVPTWSTALNSALQATGNLLGDITVCQFNISNNLEAYYVMNDPIMRALIPNQRRYEGRMTIGFVDETTHTRFLGEFNNTYAANPSGKGDGVGNVVASVLTDAAQTWVINELVGANLIVLGVSYPITANDATTITVTGSPAAGAQPYAITGYTTGYGTWVMPWYSANRQKYYAMNVFYDNSSLGITPAVATYRKIDITVLGVKFKELTSPRQVNGIIYQDFSWQGLMLAPYNGSDFVGGIVLYDDISKANFHSTSTGIN